MKESFDSSWRPSSSDIACPVCHHFKQDPKYRKSYRDTAGSRSKHVCPIDVKGNEIRCHVFDRCPLKESFPTKAEKLHAKELANNRRIEKDAERKRKQEESQKVKEEKLAQQKKTKFARIETWEDFKRTHNIDNPTSDAQYFNRVSDAARVYIEQDSGLDIPIKKRKPTEQSYSASEIEGIDDLVQSKKRKPAEQSYSPTNTEGIDDLGPSKLKKRKMKPAEQSYSASKTEGIDDLAQSFEEDVSVEQVIEIEDTTNSPREPSKVIEDEITYRCYCGDIPSLETGIMSGKRYLSCSNGISGCDYFHWLEDPIFPKTTDDLYRVLVLQGKKLDTLTKMIGEITGLMRKSK